MFSEATKWFIRFEETGILGLMVSGLLAKQRVHYFIFIFFFHFFDTTKL